MQLRINRAFVFVALATLFFSTMEIALKGIADNFTALQVNVTRFFIGGLALIPFALRELRRGRDPLTLKVVLELAALGLLGIVLSMGFYQLAVERAPASVIAVVFCSNTAFVLLFAHLFLGSPVVRSQILAICLALSAILVILLPQRAGLGLEALVLAVLAPATFGLYAVLSTPLCLRLSGVVVTCATFLLGSVELLLLVALAQVDAVGSFFAGHGLGFLVNADLFAGYNWASFWGMLYVSVGVSGMGYACYFMAAEVSNPFTASLVFFFKPVLAPILAWLILGENIPLFMLVGIALFVAGSGCLVVVRLKDLRLMEQLGRQVRHWQKVQHHRQWKDEHAARLVGGHAVHGRHFHPHLDLVLRKRALVKFWHEHVLHDLGPEKKGS